MNREPVDEHVDREESHEPEPCEVCEGKGWYAGVESGHGCDGTDEVCQMVCPVPVQIQIQCAACEATGWQLGEAPAPLCACTNELTQDDIDTAEECCRDCR